MKKIIVINGSGGVGKDTFVSLFAEVAEKFGFGKVLNYSSVQEVKKIASMCGWNMISKSERDRKFLSDLKHLISEYNDAPYKWICFEIAEFNSAERYSNYSFMFIHVREPKEIERICAEHDASSLLIVNRRVEPINSNDADANVNEYSYDYVIHNDGTLDELRDAASGLLLELEIVSNQTDLL